MPTQPRPLASPAWHPRGRVLAWWRFFSILTRSNLLVSLAIAGLAPIYHFTFLGTLCFNFAGAGHLTAALLFRRFRGREYVFYHNLGFTAAFLHLTTWCLHLGLAVLLFRLGRPFRHG